MRNVHPDAGLRTVAERIERESTALRNDVMQNRRVYDALLAVDLGRADPGTRRDVERQTLEMRLSGVDKDDETRRRIKALSDELVDLAQEFDRNVRDDRRTVVVEPSELEGLPPDFVTRHTPGADGRVALTVERPDALPVLTYAKREDLRRRVYTELFNRGYPKNMAVLGRMLAARHEIARLTGFPTWADLATADLMAESARNASDFIDRIADASAARARREYEALLARERQDAPGADTVRPWDARYVTELVRRSSYDFDAEQARAYFPFERVKQGVLDVTSRLFGVSYRRVKDAPVWHPSVECWEVLERGRVVGRFYLDMHPRPGKYQHFANFTIRAGVAGRQLPEAALVGNFPASGGDDPGLMEHADVTTFFHEFGHVLHFLFAGRHRWFGTDAWHVEGDFGEAPSKMLEEWASDPRVVATFARHYRTGEPIPPTLVAGMRRAEEFGKGLSVRQSLVFAKLSLSLHDRDPARLDTDTLTREICEEYLPWPFADGTHPQAGFGHLTGYHAIYYTYLWSQVIAKDMFGRFDRSDLLDPRMGKRYRDAVLAPGGSAPAAALLERFLGRPFDERAWRAWLEEGE
jgi:thimet oligopeptidase